MQHPLGMISAILIALSAMLVIPVAGVLLIPHVLMLLIISYGFCVRPLLFFKYMLIVTVLCGVYFLILEFSHGLGGRVVPESFKILLLLLTTITLVGHSILVRRSLFVFTYFLGIGLLIYLVFSDDPLSYGGRLGFVLDQSDPDKQISANTMGLLANFGIATIISSKYKNSYFLLPIYIFSLYLSESRGAMFVFILIIMAYFYFNEKKLLTLLVASSALLIIAGLGADDLEALRLTDATASGRLWLYPMLLSDLMDSPINWIIGFGPGAINHEIYPGKVLISAHSGYVEVIYTFGLIGTVVLLYLIYRLFKNFNKLSLDVRLYIVALAGYAISEDMLGAHTLLLFSLIYSLVATELISGKTRTFFSNKQFASKQLFKPTTP